MRIKLLAAFLLLSACAPKTLYVTPDPVRVPTLPAQLAAPSKPLPPIVGNDVKDVLKDAANTSVQYAQLRSNFDALQKLYTCVTTALNEKTDLAACLRAS